MYHRKSSLRYVLSSTVPLQIYVPSLLSTPFYPSPPLSHIASLCTTCLSLFLPLSYTVSRPRYVLSCLSVCLSRTTYLCLCLSRTAFLTLHSISLPCFSLSVSHYLFTTRSLSLSPTVSLSASLHPVLALPTFSSLYLSRNAPVRVAVSPSHSVSFDTIPCTAYQARSLSPPTFGLSMVYDADHRCRARIRRLQGRYSNNSRSCRGVIYG